jgi:hypothetical protein
MLGILGNNDISHFLLFYLFINSPWRILEDAGGAFAMGAIGSAIWHGVRGFRNSPRVILVI